MSQSPYDPLPEDKPSEDFELDPERSDRFVTLLAEALFRQISTPPPSKPPADDSPADD
jgi:hypothetical protein